MNLERNRAELAELISLTHSYLLQEYPLDKRIFAEQETYAYFKQYALQQRQKPQQPPVKSTTATPPAPLIKAQSAPSISSVPETIAAAIPKAQPVTGSKIDIPLMTSSVELTKDSINSSLAESPKQSPAPLAISTPKNEPLPPKTVQKKVALLELQPMDAPVIPDLHDLRSLVQQQSPSTAILDTIPSDTIAKQVSNQWKQQAQTPEVIILTFNESEKYLAFLHNVAKAVRLHSTPANLSSAEKIEQAKEWDKLLASQKLRLIIASDYGIYALPGLMQYYKEDSSKARCYLGNIPLLLLPDLSVYFKEPTLKASLWKAISGMIRNASLG